MKVLHLISSEGYYGAENMIVSLSSALTRLGCCCTIAAFGDARAHEPDILQHARSRGLDVEKVLCSARADWHGLAKVSELLASGAIDVLHTHGYKADLYGYAASRRSSTTLLATCHNWTSRHLLLRLYGVMDRRVLKRFHHVVAVSVPVAVHLRQAGVPPAKISVIWNGIEAERFALARAEPPGGLRRPGIKTVGFVGRLAAGKGGEVLLRAAKGVLAACPEAELVFVGDGPLRRQWELLATSLGIADKVTFAGERADMPAVYASLDIVVLPSMNEAMPMCILEAMAAGTPVIATRVGAIPELLGGGRAGVLVDAGDVNGLQDAMIRVLSDSQFAADLSRQARSRVRRTYSAEAMAKSYLSLYSVLRWAHRAA